VTRDALVGLIAGIYKRFLPPARASEEVTSESRLFGSNSPVDSIALVSMLVEVEQSVNEQCNTEIVIADDRAMSQKRSPFRTIGSLADYIHALLSEQGKAQ
jgi:acyl carrier protein